MMTRGHRGHVAWAALGALALGALVVIAPALIALLVPATLGAIGVYTLTRWLGDGTADPIGNERILNWTMASFVAHLAFGLFVSNTPAAYHYLGGDAGIYHNYAKWIVDFGSESLGHRGLQTGKEGYYYTLVGLYKVFGTYNVAALALNAALAAALVPLMSDITRRLLGSAAARHVPPLMVLLPSIFLFTSQALKEAPILFLLAVATSAAVRLAERITLASFALFTGSVALSLTFRGPVALVAGVGLISGVALAKREVLSGLTTGLSALAGLGVLVIVVGLGYSGVEATLQSSNLEETNKVRSGLAYDSASGFGSEVDTSTTKQAVSYLPIALARFTLGPFPWEIRGARQLPALLDVLVLWWLVPSAWRGGRFAVRRIGRRLSVLVLPALAMAVVLSLSVGNFGILVRERMQVMMLIVPIIALGLSLRPRSSVPSATVLPEPPQRDLALAR